jgi:hypothetical protein
MLYARIMSFTQTVEITASRRITIDIPLELPLGRAKITITTESAAPLYDCPICAENIDPVTGELRFNAETLAAFEEGDAMMRGDIPVKWYSSAEEMWADLDKDDADDMSDDD